MSKACAGWQVLSNKMKKKLIGEDAPRTLAHCSAAPDRRRRVTGSINSRRCLPCSGPRAARCVLYCSVSLQLCRLLDRSRNARRSSRRGCLHSHRTNRCTDRIVGTGLLRSCRRRSRFCCRPLTWCCCLYAASLNASLRRGCGGLLQALLCLMLRLLLRLLHRRQLLLLLALPVLCLQVALALRLLPLQML